VPPPQRYKLTDEIKGIIWQLVTINNEQAAMTNQMQCVYIMCLVPPSFFFAIPCESSRAEGFLWLV
jgi:hypothetical protein